MTATEMSTSWNVCRDVLKERVRQDEKWGQQNHPDGTGGRPMIEAANEQRLRTDLLAESGLLDWRSILLEEVYEALAEEDPVKLREELVQVAAVAVAWVEAIDRR